MLAQISLRDPVVQDAFRDRTSWWVYPVRGFFSLNGSGFLSALSTERDAQLFWYWYAQSATLCGLWSRFVTRVSQTFVSKGSRFMCWKLFICLRFPNSGWWAWPVARIRIESRGLVRRQKLMRFARCFLGLSSGCFAYYRGAPLRQGGWLTNVERVHLQYEQIGGDGILVVEGQLDKDFSLLIHLLSPGVWARGRIYVWLHVHM